MVKQGQVIGAQLRKAREILQLSPQEVAESLGTQQEEIVTWEREQEMPSLQHLERLAELYGREIDYFLKETPSLPSQIQFRSATRHSLSELSIEARKVIAKFDELCRSSTELEEVLGKKQPVKLKHVSQNVLPLDLAKSERKALKLDDKPVVKLRDILTRKGIRIFELPVPQNDFSGFSYSHEVYGPCVLINAKDEQGRRSFTLAHEYGHLLYKHAALVCEISKQGRPGPITEERKADLFAIEFLLPPEPLRGDFIEKHISRTPTVKEIGRLAARWVVSVQAMGYRLEDLNLIEKGHTDKVLASYTPSHPRRPKTPTWKRRLGEVYVSNAIEAYRRGEITLGKLAHSLGIDIRKALEVTGEH